MYIFTTQVEFFYPALMVLPIKKGGSMKPFEHSLRPDPPLYTYICNIFYEVSYLQIPEGNNFNALLLYM